MGARLFDMNPSDNQKMDVFDKDREWRRILKSRGFTFWESVQSSMAIIARKAESPIRRIVIADTMPNQIKIQSEEGRCSDAFSPKARTLTVDFDKYDNRIDTDTRNTCPGLSEKRIGTFTLEADLEAGDVFALLDGIKFSDPASVANDIIGKFFGLKPLVLPEV
jgi:hypothetical protein